MDFGIDIPNMSTYLFKYCDTQYCPELNEINMFFLSRLPCITFDKCPIVSPNGDAEYA